MTVFGAFVEAVALLLVVVATLRLPRIWRAPRTAAPSWYPYGESTWTYTYRAIVPMLGGAWGLVLAFPATWYSDESTAAGALLIILAAWVLTCVALSGLLALTNRFNRFVPRAWR